MRCRVILSFFAGVCALAGASAAAQARTLPPSVDLGIPNIQQQTDVWCWAAVAQQVIIKRRRQSPPQCALVAMIHGKYPSYCCPNYERCHLPGTLEQIQTLIRNFGQRTSALQAPTDAMTLYRTLRAGRPVILALRNSQVSGHVIVLTGMTWVQGARGPEALLHVNDPLNVIPTRMAWRELLPRWRAAIVVY
jgi:hypothetical protein